MKIDVGNWVLASPKVGELTVTNRDGNQQRMLIMEDLPGFIFESNRQTKHCFQAESTLGMSFPPKSQGIVNVVVPTTQT